MTTVTASIGVAASADSGVSPENLLHRADQAMYDAKRTGCGVSAFPVPANGTTLPVHSSAPAIADRLEGLNNHDPIDVYCHVHFACQAATFPPPTGLGRPTR